MVLACDEEGRGRYLMVEIRVCVGTVWRRWEVRAILGRKVLGSILLGRRYVRCDCCLWMNSRGGAVEGSLVVFNYLTVSAELSALRCQY